MRRSLVAGMVSGILGGVIRGIVEEKVYVLRDMKAYRTQKLELAITLRSQPERLMLSMERTAKWAGLGAVFCCLYTAGTCMFDTEQLGVFGVGLSAGPAGAVTGALSGSGFTRWRQQPQARLVHLGGAAQGAGVGVVLAWIYECHREGMFQDAQLWPSFPGADEQPVESPRYARELEERHEETQPRSQFGGEGDGA